MSQMGFLGALGGAGKGTADIGESLMKDSLMRQQQTEDDERRMRIEEFRIGAARAEEDRMYGRQRADKLSDDKADREHDIAKIREMAKTKGASQSARTRLYPMGEDDMGNKIFGRYDEETDTLIPVSPEEAGMQDEEAMSKATKEADERDPIGPNWLRGDATKKAFGEGGREAWINNRALELQGKKPQNGGVQNDAIPGGLPQGSRRIGTSGGKPVYEAPNGKRYIVE